MSDGDVYGFFTPISIFASVQYCLMHREESTVVIEIPTAPENVVRVPWEALCTPKTFAIESQSPQEVERMMSGREGCQNNGRI